MKLSQYQQDEGGPDRFAEEEIAALTCPQCGEIDACVCDEVHVIGGEDLARDILSLVRR